MINPADFPYLPIEKGNHLVLIESKRTQKKGMDNDDDYYNEVSPEGDVVASYHVWHHINIYPPQNVNEGWKKYNANNEFVSSGKCKL